VARSLERARTRAELRGARFVDAAFDLLEETGSDDFTIHAVVERCGASTRTFYEHFSGKTDLIVAMFEEAQRESIAALAPLVEAESDPLARLRTFVIGRQNLTRPGPLSRLFVHHRFRLQENHPSELRIALAPVVDYLHDLVKEASDTGAIQSRDYELTTELILQTLTAFIQGRVFGSALVERETSAEEVWAFIVAGLVGEPSTSLTSRARLSAAPRK